MKIATDFNIGETVRIKDGKYKNGVGVILGISLFNKDNETIVMYSIEVALDSKISRVNRSTQQIRHTDLVRRGNCSTCHTYKVTVYEGFCEECLVKYKDKLEDDIYRTRQTIDGKKMLLFADSSTADEKEDILSEIIYLLGQIKDFEKFLRNTRSTIDAIEGKRKKNWD